jgi:hypothetical protein
MGLTDIVIRDLLLRRSVSIARQPGLEIAVDEDVQE